MESKNVKIDKKIGSVWVKGERWEEIGDAACFNSADCTLRINGPWPGSDNIAVLVRRHEKCPEILVGDGVKHKWNIGPKVVLAVNKHPLAPLSTVVVANSTGARETYVVGDISSVYRDGGLIWEKSKGRSREIQND